MKKALKIIGIILLIIVLILVAVPYVFESQIKDVVKNYINKNIDAQVDFTDVNLSLLRSFPKARVSIEDLSVINNAPFKGETLATAKSIYLEMPVKDLFNKANEPIQINELALDEALLTLKTDKFGNDNYDVFISEDSIDRPKDNAGNSFNFNIENYSIDNTAFNYLDEKSGIKISVVELNHYGQGNFSSDNSALTTSSDGRLSIELDSTKYLDNSKVKLDAIIDLDLDKRIYTLKDNKGFVNDLPIEFSGFVKQLDSGQDIDITFNNPESSFKAFLGVMPSTYSKNIEDVDTEGNFKVDGSIKGISNKDRIPQIDIKITSENASFKYPNLPKSVENINLNVSVKNETGQSDDTYIAINTLNFKIDQDEFIANGTLKNLTKNIYVNANVDGVLNLANISQAYPVELKNKLQGILKAKLNTSFDMDAIETNSYGRIKNNGKLLVNDFIFSSADIVNPIHISSANIDFKPGTTTLKSFNATTGQSDIVATGTMNNLMGFLLSDKNLQGTFDVNSKQFVVGDFMVEHVKNNEDETSKSEAIKIPSFLDTTINANVKTVVYDNLELKDVKGLLIIKDEVATLNNVTSGLFDGKIALKGHVDTTKKVPSFQMNLGVDGFDISQSFNNLNLLQTLAPIAKLLQGKLNSTINLAGNLTTDYTPEISSISGDADTELLTSAFNPGGTELLEKLGGALNFIEFDKLDLKDLKTKLTFANGMVNVNPFNINYKDIAITVEGSHGFDKSLNYDAVFNVPASYLGSEINRLIGKIDDAAVSNISIPVTATIGGTYTSPTVSTDLTSGIANLTKQLIEIQKQKLIRQGQDEIKDIIDDVLGGNSVETDSTDVGGTSTIGTNPIEDEVQDVLGGLLGGNTKETDSTQIDTTKSNPSDPIKDVLGGLLGGKKDKKEPAVKDSLN